MDNTHIIYLAGGCFWGIEQLMQLIPGVTDTKVGYANSSIPYPSYEMVCMGVTAAVEAVKVDYDSRIVDLDSILDIFFTAIDPTSRDRQGNDSGSQYRSAVFYKSIDIGMAVAAYFHRLREEYADLLAVEMAPLDNFYPAESYHQKYLMRNPHGYCNIDPRCFRMASSVIPKGTLRMETSKASLPLTPHDGISFRTMALSDTLWSGYNVSV